MSMNRWGSSVLLLLVVPVCAGAQSVTSVRVVRAAAVLEQPVGDARPVGTVAIGELLDVLDERAGWYLVRPPAGAPAREWRTGWVNSMTVEPMARGAAGPPVQSTPPPAMDPYETSAKRKGFLIGFGAGGGLHRTPSFSVYDRFGRLTSNGGGTNNFAIVTNFMIGYAPTDRALLYYSNKAAFSADENYNLVGVTGFGMTYMFRRTAPTGYVTGSIGGGIGTDLYEGSTPERGLGWSVGAGWEFKRHLSVEGDVLFVKLEDGLTHTVYRGLFHFTFY